MTTERLRAAVRHLRQVVGRGPPGDATDQSQLERFVAERDEEAFAAIVRRHGPMVLGVCRRILGDADAADDAFQATFLVLVHRARSLRKPELLGPWLYGVAYRTSLKARAQSLRRWQHEQRAALPAAYQPADEVGWADLRALLDEEITRLPEKYRRAFVLCYLEERTNEETARLLGCPVGTVFSRLASARQRLRNRLARRGLALSLTTLTALLAGQPTSAAVPAALLGATLRAAALLVTEKTTAAISPKVAALTHEVLRAMLLTRLKPIMALLLAVALLGPGAVLLMHGAQAGKPGASGQEPAAAAKPGRPETSAKKPAGRPDLDPSKEEAGPAWGKPVNGLRAGLHLQGEKRPYALGERVSFAFTLGNVSDRPITFTYFTPVFHAGGSPTVIGPDGKRADVSVPAFDGPVQPEQATLAPGKTLELGTPYFLLGTEGNTGKLTETTLIVPVSKEPGGRSVFKVHYRYHLDVHSKGDWSGELATGEVEVEVSTNPAAEEELRKEHARLRGTWWRLGGSLNDEWITIGSTFVRPEDSEPSWTIKEDKITYVYPTDIIQLKRYGRGATYKIDPARSPKQFDLLQEDGTTLPGIYLVEGDILIVCLKKTGRERPKELVSDWKAGQVLLVFQRTGKR